MMNRADFSRLLVQKLNSRYEPLNQLAKEPSSLKKLKVLKVKEVLASSELSWENAVQKAVEEAANSIETIRSVVVKDFSAKVLEGKVMEFQACIKIIYEID